MGETVTHPKVHNKVLPDIESLLALVAQKQTHDQIAERYGVTRAAISTALKRHRDKSSGKAVAKLSRADSFKGHIDRLLNSVTDEDIKKMSPAQRYVAMGICYDKYRDETGKSTPNTLTISMIVQQATSAPKKGKAVKVIEASEVKELDKP